MSGILIIAEHKNNSFKKVTFEAVTCGRQLAKELNADLFVAVLGEKISDLSQEFADWGVNKIILAENELLKNYTSDGYAKILSDIVGKYKPDVILLGATAFGRDIAPKLAAKLNKHIIIRTSWLFGPNGKNFISTIARLAKEKETIEVVSDQTGSPTYTLDLAKAISDIINTHFTKDIAPGIYNITNTGFCSWAELASYAIKESGLQTQVVEIKSEQLKRKAVRPKNSMLLKEKFKTLNGYYLPNWQEAVKHYLKNYILN